jgi:hypothetical protein
MKRRTFLAALCVLPSFALAETYSKIDDYIVDQYRQRGETSATAECLARSMVLAIPSADSAALLKAVNGQADASELMDKWLPIGNEKVRPEINDTMYGFCPIEWTDYVGKGTLR